MILELQHRRPDGDVDTYHLKPGRRYHLGRGSGCEVRILDLKLSRKHAALEFIDHQWQLIDLCSTNGCRLDGEQVIGTNPLQVGVEIEIGQTTLVIAGIGVGNSASSAIPVVAELVASPPPSEKFKPQMAERQPQWALANRSGVTAEFPPGDLRPESDENFQPTSLPPEFAQRGQITAITPVVGHAVVPPLPVPVIPPPALAAHPQAATHSATAERPQMVTKQPRAAIRPIVLKTEPADDHTDTLAATPPPFVMPATPTPLSRAPEIPPAQVAAEERSYFITVLGKRIGPLSRAVARDLKARELKGVLRPADIESYPSA